jgi:anti-anti-sigma factor
MEIKINGSGNKGQLAIDGEMNIYSAGDSKIALIEALGKYRELEIDLAAVTHIDTTGIQLLVLLKREAAKAGNLLRLTNHSPVTLAAFDTFNLTAHFGDPVVIPSK